MAPVAPPGENHMRVSNAAERPFPAGTVSSHARKAGWARSGGAGNEAAFRRIVSRILAVGSWNANRGEPATTRSAPARTSCVASAVDIAWACGPKPSAIARATAAVLPHKDSYTTTAFMTRLRSWIPVTAYREVGRGTRNSTAGKRDLTEAGRAHRVEAMKMDTAWSAETRGRIEQALEKAFAALPSTEVAQAARYAVQGGGHRWRGLLAVAAGRIFDPEADVHAVPLAAALEMMHAATLVLDDLPSMDNAALRRGKPCVHLVFPRSVVDLLAVFLVNLAYGVVADHPQVSEGCRVRVVALLGEMGSRLARGQELDLTLARAPVSEAALLECDALKSGSLFAAALAGGGLLCGAGPSDAAALREAGLKLGQAYQILDDVADGPEEDSEYKAAGRFTAYSLFGPEGARARAARLLEEVSRILDRFGPASARLRGVLDEILPPSAPQAESPAVSCRETASEPGSTPHLPM
ncbi:MAG: hypothetical protein EOM72_01860 [Opitutae bacterium]|nr:hypothetical protein [Opitutae bacterium]